MADISPVFVTSPEDLAKIPTDPSPVNVIFAPELSVSPAAAANIPIFFFPDIVIELSLPSVAGATGVFLSDIFTIPSATNIPVFSSPVDVIAKSFTSNVLVPA